MKDFLWQMLSATQYLHAHRILHLDLRSENMMVTEYNLLKVVDLGSAQSLDQGQVFPSETFKDYLETMGAYLLSCPKAMCPAPSPPLLTACPVQLRSSWRARVLSRRRTSGPLA